MPQTVPISEIFASVQGEGRFLGRPALFVRLAGCNLRCRWGETRCDTPYASWEASGADRTVSEVVDAVRVLAAQFPGIDCLILTGGEPTMHPGVDVLAHGLARLPLALHLETNGTRALSLPLDFVSVSPKLASSEPLGTPFEAAHRRDRIDCDALRFWVRRYPHQLKFQFHDAGDEAEIAELVGILGVRPADVCLMPQGATREQLLRRAPQCVELCLRHGWRYSPRAHIDLYGATRGR